MIRQLKIVQNTLQIGNCFSNLATCVIVIVALLFVVDGNPQDIQETCFLVRVGDVCNCGKIIFVEVKFISMNSP
ncbi:MAG: hypothetical protein COB08_001270 [Rhodobacteraceae bacterium]|nr:hypothetical protein [Paracoccaceae bacterium]